MINEGSTPTRAEGRRWLKRTSFKLLGIAMAIAVAVTGFAQENELGKQFRIAARNAMNANPNLKFTPTTLMVRFAANQTESAKAALRATAGVTLIEKVKLVPGLEIVGVPSDPLAAVSRLRALPGVLYAEPDYVVRATVIPNDTNFSLLYGMHNTGQTGGVADADIDAPEAWDIFTGDPNFVCAVIDTGVELAHPDLVGNIWTNPGETPGNNVDDDGNGYVDDMNGWDFYNNDNNPNDDHYHGTHCSGTIAGRGDNSLGVAGVNWRLKIMALKFLGANGSGSTSNGVLATQYAISKGTKISSNSWGGGGFSQAMYDAINAGKAVNHLFIAAAGNNGSNNDSSPFYPASYTNDNLVAVAAVDHNDGIASFSNYGATSVDLGAPGVSVYSTLYPTTYGYLSGTSMACPHVSGVAALIYGYRPDFNWMQVKSALMATTRPIASLSGKCVTGGMVNAYSALLAIKAAEMTISPAALVGGSTALGTISLASSAPVGGLVFNLSTNHSKVFLPPSVTVPGGSNLAQFLINTAPVLAMGTATVTGQTPGGLTASTTFDILPHPLASFTITPGSVQGGASAVGKVTLSSPAPSGGTVVQLFEGSPFVNCPSSVLVPAGNSVWNVTIGTSPAPGNQNVTVTAVLGAVNKPATLQVLKPQLDSVTTPLASFTGGATIPVTAFLTSQAPASGIPMSMWDNSAYATTPASATIAGTSSKTVDVPTLPCAATQTVKFSAMLFGVTKTVTVTLKPPTIASYTVIPAVLKGGYATSGIVMLDQPAPLGGITVTLWGGNAYLDWRPATVTIPAGAISTSFMMITKTTTTAVTFATYAQVGSYAKRGDITILP